MCQLKVIVEQSSNIDPKRGRQRRDRSVRSAPPVLLMPYESHTTSVQRTWKRVPSQSDRAGHEFGRGGALMVSLIELPRLSWGWRCLA